MAFEFEQTNLTTQKIVGVDGFSVLGKLTSLDETQPAKILKITAFPKVNNFEMIGSGASFSGAVNVKLVYVSATGEPEAVSGQIEFQGKCELPSDMSGVTLVPKMEEMRGTIVDDGVSLSGQVSLCAVGQTSVEIKKLIADETIVTKTEKTVVKGLGAQSKEDFNLVEDFGVPGDIDEVLSAHCQVGLKNVFATADEVTLEGECFVELLCKTEQGLSTINKSFEFKQEVACFGASTDQFASVKLWTTSAEAILGEQDDAKTVNMTVGVECVVSTNNEIELELVTDAFSVDGESTTASQGVAYDVFAPQVFVTDTVATTINIEKFPNFDEIKTVLVNKAQITELVPIGEKTEAKGVIDVEVVFITPSGQVSGHQAQLPFNVVVPSDVSEVSNLCAQLSSFKIRGTHDLELIAHIGFVAQKTHQEYVNFVSSVAVSDEKLKDDAGVLMYVVKENEDLFDISRALKVRPEQISMQNDNIDKVVAGDRIFVYLPQKAEF